ncbi:unnamed protein product, partial [Sphacelaria rigidula]
MVRVRTTTRGKQGSKKPSHPFGAGRSVSDGGSSAQIRSSSCASRARRGGVDSTTSPPAAPGHFAGAAAADGVSSERVARCMKLKMEMTLPAALLREGITSNGLAAARSSIYGSMAKRNLS